MATVECRSAQAGVPSAWVEIDHVTDDEVVRARLRLDALLARGGQVSDAVATAFLEVTASAPQANPSDLWHHVIYRHLLAAGWNDAQWKRVSGFALERAFVGLYTPRLVPHGVRLRIVKGSEANKLLAAAGLAATRHTKVDIFVEGQVGGEWRAYGATHVKSSIAERIQDDVPASLALMERGMVSVLLTMDIKSYPPPHGSCVNYGELGGRSLGVEKDRLKRNYIEVDGQFDALFSYNLRTPPSAGETPSGKRIITMGMHGPQPDAFVGFLAERWAAHPNAIAV